MLDASTAALEKICVWEGESRKEEGRGHCLKSGIGLGFTLDVPSEKAVNGLLYSSEVYLKCTENAAVRSSRLTEVILTSCGKYFMIQVLSEIHPLKFFGSCITCQCFSLFSDLLHANKNVRKVQYKYLQMDIALGQMFLMSIF